MTLTVKDFAKTLKISDEALLQRMQKAGLSHSKGSDEITPSDKQALLKSLKGASKSKSKSVTSESGVKVTSKGKSSSATSATKNYSDDIEAKRAAASEQLKEQQIKREEQLKAAIKEKQTQKKKQFKTAKDSSAAEKVDVKDQLSSAVSAYKKKEQNFVADSQHQFETPKEFIKKDIEVPETIQVGELAKLMAVKGGEVVKNLMSLGTVATTNDIIDQDTAILVVEEIGHNGIPVQQDNFEEDLASLIEYKDKPKSRPPVITVMGHVDHGKTSLLDFIRKASVASGEAGGITQHIGAYHVQTKQGMISFLDTPGHAAFTAMRSRGAKATDVIVLVVAADDGVKPQTEEAVQHAKAAGVPLVVAINKMDKEGVDPDRVKNELSAMEVIPEDWGGDVQFIEVSAITGSGVENLLEAILLQAELLELTAYTDVPGQGVVIESRLDKGRGPVASVLVKNGTLKSGDIVLAGFEHGRVRALIDELGENVKSAGPSLPVEILGLNGVPEAGDEFVVVPDEKSAREVANFRKERYKDSQLAKQQSGMLDNMFSSIGSGEKKVFNLVLKADVRGSLEAITSSLNKLETEEVGITIVASSVGGISENDAHLAVTSNATIFGFNVRADKAARDIIESEALQLRYYNVIYDVIDDAKQIMGGMLAPEIREEIVGIAEVRDVFNSPKFGQIAGSMVIEGTVFRSKPIRVLRDNVVIYEGELESLRRFKDDATEVRNGMECGIGVRNYNDVKIGDKIEVFETTEIARSL